MSFRFAVLYGSVRRDRKGIGVARFLVDQLRARGHEVDLVDVKERPLPLLDRMHKEYDEGEAPAAMQEIHEILERADGFVIVSGEYNHGLQPGLKNLLDTFQREYFFKPAGIASYSNGAFAGQRAAPHLRAVLHELGMYSLSTMFAVSRVGKSFDQDGNVLDEAYLRRVKGMLDELEWLADALKRKRAQGDLPF